MDLRVIYKNARCAVLEVENDGIYETSQIYRLYLNGKFTRETGSTITGIYDLKPDTSHQVEARSGKGLVLKSSFTAGSEFVILDVHDFGVKGGGVQNDTLFIQAAIMTCPKKGRVLIPARTCRIVSLFLKDDVNIELAEGTVLSTCTDRTRSPVLQGIIQSYDEQGEHNLGTWKGNSLPMSTGITSDANVRGAVIYGQGTIDGDAGDSEGNWWHEPRVIHTACRLRMIFLERCRQVTARGVMARNSPSWNIHPYFSDHLRLSDLRVLNPRGSSDTDGLNLESYQDVKTAGVCSSLRNDYIAVKLEKIYTGPTCKRPSKDMSIRRCCMGNDHGSVTIGSEMTGGVKNLAVKDRMFLCTNRGLRIRMRRSRGKGAAVDGIVSKHIRMDHVMTPFVTNCSYFCDPDSHSKYVRTKEALLVDKRTPLIRSLCLEDIEAEDCHMMAAYIYGLPGQRIGRVEMDHVRVTYAASIREGQPVMMDGCSFHVCRMGIYTNQIEELTLTDVKVKGQDGPAIITESVGRVHGSV